VLPQQNSKHFSSPSYVTVFPSHSTLLDLIALKIFGELYKSWNCATELRNFLQPLSYFFCLRSKCLPQHPNLTSLQELQASPPSMSQGACSGFGDRRPPPGMKSCQYAH
jgi:hypothetical protein